MTETGTGRIVVYPGTFDPVTNGHLSLIERVSSLFDKTIVAVSRNPGKAPLFAFDKRLEMMQASVDLLDIRGRIEIAEFDGLLAAFAVKRGASAILRGLRAISDFEYEFQMALMNRRQAREVETIFLMPSLSWVYLSSSIVKEVAGHGGDVSGLVPEPVSVELEKLSKGSNK